MNKLKVFTFLCTVFYQQVAQIAASDPQTTVDGAVIPRLPSTRSCDSPNEVYAVDAQRPQNTCETYGCYGYDQCPGSSDTGDCYCRKGYARKSLNGPCVSIKSPCCAAKLPTMPKDCRKLENEVYFENPYFGMCPNTCENVVRICPVLMTLIAVRPTWGPRCDCKKGFARLPTGKCVPISDPRCYDLYKPSEAQCELRGEVYRVGKICEDIPDCSHPDGYTNVCLAEGPMPRCYCPDGYLRESDGTCVRKDRCGRK